jgi:hypothetical protein
MKSVCSAAVLFASLAIACAHAPVKAPAHASSRPSPSFSSSRSASDPFGRVIHSRGGDRPVKLNQGIALTRSNGPAVLGKLIAVDKGFVDVKTSSSRLRIAERDVLDAASYAP